MLNFPVVSPQYAPPSGAEHHFGARRAPAPQALFKGFGESSLDFVLRAWTDEEYESRTSESALAIHRSLCNAGIAIPFPQRDLHLAILSPDVHAALARLDRKA